MKNLCQAIIWVSCFLELSGDDVIDPDSAIKALEDLAATMQGATDEEKANFRQACATEAEGLETQGGPEYSETIEFIRSIPDAMGILEANTE